MGWLEGSVIGWGRQRAALLMEVVGWRGVILAVGMVVVVVVVVVVAEKVGDIPC